MGQLKKSTIAVDNEHTVPQKALDCRPGLGGIIYKIIGHLCQNM